MTEAEAFSIITKDLHQTLCRMFQGSTLKHTAEALAHLNALCQSALKDIQRQGYFHDFKVDVKVDRLDPSKLNITFMPPAGWVPVRFEVSDGPPSDS